MCGINGFNYSNPELLGKMEKFTSQRGPDANGYYYDQNVSLGHNRLSIIDTSEKSNQPMIYGDYVITYNGEIYNYKILRKSLIEKGVLLNTLSDTEVILGLFSLYGVNAFKMLSGIFSIAIWNKRKKKLYLIRDHLGVKPLYYVHKIREKKIYFSSSIQSLIEVIDKKEISRKALLFYQNLGRNDSTETFISEVKKLEPGQLIILGQNFFIKKKNFLKFKYTKKKFSNEEAKKKIETIISNQFVSDVPIALSLSGGIDSNVIFHCLRKFYKKNFSIYSFYFKDYDKFNEDFKVAEKNAKFYNYEFQPIIISYNDFIDNSEKIIETLEEPLRNDASVLNYVMAKSIKEKVLFTGDGGDEVFTGYDQYRSIYFLSILNKMNIFKRLFKSENFKNKQLSRLFSQDSRNLFLSFSERNLFKSPEKYYKNFRDMTVNDINYNHSFKNVYQYKLNEVSQIELDTRVQNDYLMRNDKLFMSQGIEVRVPFFDVEMINNFLQVSENKKFGYRGSSKFILKNLFKNEIHNTTKRKWGLQSPLAKWMKKELQPYLKEILSSSYYDGSKKYINFNEVENLIKLHKEKYFNHFLLWSLVNLQIYLRKFKL